MGWSFSIGRLFGSELRVHVTFFLLLAWIGYVTYADGGWPAALENVVFVIALFACVVAHEFGHALTARRYGIKTPTITLLPIGGLAQLERMPETPTHEILVALAGPMVNVVIWAVLMLAGVDMSFDIASETDLTGPDFFGRLAFVNLFLAVFNLIPAFPMDGGRVFRAVLSLFTNRVRATRIAAAAGQIVALLFGFAGLSSGNPMLILIAVFVFIAANAESQDVAMRAVARQLVARDATITSFESLTPEDTLQAATSALVHTTQHEFPVIGIDGTFLGFVTRTALFAALAQEGPRSRPVSEIMTTGIPSMTLTTRLEKVLNALYQGAPAVTVTDSKGNMIGYITRENVGELMVINGR
ncbi:site-2 protease family protein [Aquicoccus sp. SU-CL01552]|uniref:site-2 protease family protein n=1 Tax=Aquicoccus sp. SU-CL01552 TaxID=3127656 RepID=UPI0031081E59